MNGRPQHCTKLTERGQFVPDFLEVSLAPSTNKKCQAVQWVTGQLDYFIRKGFLLRSNLMRTGSSVGQT